MAKVQKMNKLIGTAVLVLIILLCSNLGYGQITININVAPPFSPYYTDYTNAEAAKTLVLLQNTSAVQQKIRLSGKLQGDNGVLLTTKPNYIPLQPIILNPHETKQLNGFVLKDVLDINNVNVSGIDKTKLALSTRIPEGNYTLCVQAEDYNTGAFLSPSAPQGCTIITITYPEPPVLVGPAPNEHIRATPNQNVIMTWINPGTVPIGTQYKLEIAEMPDVAADPNQVLNASSFPVLSTNVTGTSYIYNANNVPLKPGKRYAWRVTSSDPTNRVFFRNNGISPASSFTYEPLDAAAPPAVVGIPQKPDKQAPDFKQGNKYSVSGKLIFQYHLSASEVQPSFAGLKADSVPLKNQVVQLCYGLLAVDMKITRTPIVEYTKVVKKVVSDKLEKAQKDEYKVTYEAVKDDKQAGRPLYLIDSIPQTAAFNNAVTPYYNGDVVATTTTDVNGFYKFDFKNDRQNKIVYADGASNKAFIYCYYINIVDKHYTDPYAYIYAKAPADNETSTVSAGTNCVFVKNYNLMATISRNLERGTNTGGQDAISETNVDEVAQLYVLRVKKPSSPLPPPGSLNSQLPAKEGDNSGMALFQFADNDKINTNDSYYVVARADVSITHGDFLKHGYEGSHVFNNMLDNLDADESYWLFARYKNTKVYFSPVEQFYSPDDNDEYQPVQTLDIPTVNATVKPSYISVVVKGILKYDFADGVKKPLANVAVGLESIKYSAALVNGQPQIVYDYDNKDNKSFKPVVTDANGYFEITSGEIAYDQYAAGYTSFFVGFNQFIRVISPHYGSPDQYYNFEAGNTYNVGEVEARVKEYSMAATVKGINPATKVLEPLAGQRVYLCRKADFDKAARRIPADEGEQATIPVKTLTTPLDGNKAYNVVSYGQTNKDGMINFKRLVLQDPNTDDEGYYVYSESGVLSELNYSTENAPYTLGSIYAGYVNYKINDEPVFNSIVSKVNIATTNTIISKPQAPYIEGAIYPKSNTSTNIISGVKVNLYDVDPSKYSFDQFNADVLKGDADYVAYKMVKNNQAQLEDGQITTEDGRFSFVNPTRDPYKNGWKLVVYSKYGFVAGYTVVNAGHAMGLGIKENIKGFLLPPRWLMANVADKTTGLPVKAKVVVGQDFSWAQTQPTANFNNSQQFETATFTSSYGDSVLFTVIPEDNIHYHTQTFKRPVAYPANFNGATQLTTADAKPVKIDDFLLSRPITQFVICAIDEVTKKYVWSTVSITGLPANETPAPLTGNCPGYELETTATHFGVKVSAPGYVTQQLDVIADTDPYADPIMVHMVRGLTIKGVITVHNIPVGNAKVYIKELAGLSADVYTAKDGTYSISGLPVNGNYVTLVADAAGAVGTTKSVMLTFPVKAAGQVLADPYTKTVNVDLLSNYAINLASLYGFPLDIESFTQKANGNYTLSGRIKVAANNTLKPGDNPYLNFSNVEVATIAAPQPAGGSKVKINPILKAVANTITVIENTFPVTAYNTYQAAVSATKGIQITPVNTDCVTGNIYASLLLSADDFDKSISWTGNAMLIPDMDKDEGNINGVGINPQATPNNPFTPPNQIGNLPTPAGNTNTGTVTPRQQGQSPGQQGVVDQVLANLLANRFNVFVSTVTDMGFNKYHILAPTLGTLTYKLNNIYDVDASSKSYLNSGGLHLFSTVHTQLQNVDQPDILLNAGEVVATNNPLPVINGASDLVIPLDSWKLSGKWHIGQSTIKLTGNLFAGTVTLPVTDMEVSKTSIGYGDIKVTNLGLGGVYQMTINPDEVQTSFGYDVAAKYGTIGNAQYGAWSISLLPKDADAGKAVATLNGLKDLNPADVISIMNISLYSKGGESRFILMPGQHMVTVNSFAHFQPFELENGPGYFAVNGALDLAIPALTGLSDQTYSLRYESDGTNLVHKTAALPLMNLVANGVRVAFGADGQTFTDNRLVLTGVLQDKVTNSPYQILVNLTKTQAGTVILNTADDKQPDKNIIDLGRTQNGNDQLLKVTAGTMFVDNSTNNWSTFKFGGDVVGAVGQRAQGDSEGGTHMEFEVKGDLVANKGAVGVSNLSFGPVSGFGLTYDFTKHAIVGSFHVKEVTSEAEFESDFELQMGNGQWYLLGAGTISHMQDVPAIHGAHGAVLIGTATITPDMMEILQAQFHDGILPNKFDFTAVKGTIVIAGVDIDIPIIPPIDIKLGPIAKVVVERGIYADAYLALDFSDTPTITGGIKAGVYVKVSAGASVLVGCAGIGLSAEVNTEINARLILPAFKVFKSLDPASLASQTDISLNGETRLLLGGDAYFGFGVCDDDCSSIKVFGVTIPPGCFKKGIEKDMNVSFGIDVAKAAGTLTPSSADVYVVLFGDKHAVNINLPNLAYK